MISRTALKFYVWEGRGREGGWRTASGTSRLFAHCGSCSASLEEIAEEIDVRGLSIRGQR